MRQAWRFNRNLWLPYFLTLVILLAIHNLRLSDPFYLPLGEVVLGFCLVALGYNGYAGVLRSWLYPFIANQSILWPFSGLKME